jgi:hypothetical protein
MWRALVIGFSLLLVGCQSATDVHAAGQRLAQSLPSELPGRIVAIDFEYNPPLDPPTLFIDLQADMTPEAQLALLCDEIAPRVRATNSDIDATVSYGWHIEDCPAE